jgi:hypothetical protein
MCRTNLIPPKILVSLFLISILMIAVFNANAQQDVIANKMNTRTDVTHPFGRPGNLKSVFLDGEENLAVRVYPTIITEKLLHATAALPVDQITINSGSGQQIFTQYVGGKGNYLSIPMPSSLTSGMYWITFAGRGWQTTSKFIIP